MVELSTIPEQTRQQIEQIRTVDLVIGLVDLDAGQAMTRIAGIVREGLGRLAKSVRAVLLHQDAGANAEAALQPGLEDESLRFLSYAPPSARRSIMLVESIAGAYRSIGEISHKLGARACVVVASSPEGLTAEWIYGLAQPILERDLDLASPCYAPHKFEGLLNSAILYPTTRALYGKRVVNPLGPDFGFSSRLLQSVLLDSWTRGTGTRLPLIAPRGNRQGTESVPGPHRQEDLSAARLEESGFDPRRGLGSVLSRHRARCGFLATHPKLRTRTELRRFSPLDGRNCPRRYQTLAGAVQAGLSQPPRDLEPGTAAQRALELTKADRLPPEQFTNP